MLSFHPYADLFPMIEGEQFAQLVADIKAHDLREKIVVWDGAILDGRNRYRAALEAGILEEDDGPDRAKYFTRFVPAVDGDPLSFVISKNLKRRHLSDVQRASIAAKITNLGRGRPGENPPSGGLTTAAAAEMLNVATRQIERARIVHKHGVPELKEALDRGEIPVATAERIAHLPSDGQVREVLVESEAAQERFTRRGGMLPNGARCLMNSRHEPDDSLDYFPTPPWATRALMEVVLPHLGVTELASAWEPACGEGHIAEVLREYAQDSDLVFPSDIFDYGYSDATIDFLTDDAAERAGTVEFCGEGDDPYDWIITNPPFDDKAAQFVLRALKLARVGVAMFFRLQWIPTKDRYEKIFRDHPPTLVAFFSERVNLCKGRWEPDGSTATDYIWLVWLHGEAPRPPFWIPPGQRQRLEREGDRQRFTTHPVTPRPRDAQGTCIPHDPHTGEILDLPHEEPQVIAQPAEADEPLLNQQSDQQDDPLDIPMFLRRSPDTEATA